MKYSKYNKEDFKDWLEMALDLWPDYKKEELSKELKEIVKSEREEAFIVKDEDKYVGFINISLRFEYVEGANSSPVGYVEGIYVKPAYRKKGIASQLLKIGEKWSAEKGCKEMGSDTWLWNKDSQAFHKKLGFEEKDTIVHFIKKIDN